MLVNHSCSHVFKYVFVQYDHGRLPFVYISSPGEYMVMVFPTKLSNEMNLMGSYIFRVTENSVHLISRDTSDHMSYKIPLCTIVRASHTVFSNSSVQFAPYSDRKSNIKVLALYIES